MRTELVATNVVPSRPPEWRPTVRSNTTFPEFGGGEEAKNP